jgi:hypothetical protein
MHHFRKLKPSLYEYAIHYAEKLLKEIYPNDYLDIAHDAYIKSISAKTKDQYQYIYLYIHSQKYNDNIVFEELQGLAYQYNYEISFKNILDSANLTPRIQRILCLYYISHFTLEEIGNKENLTRERIRQIILKAENLLYDSLVIKKKKIPRICKPTPVIPSTGEYVKVIIEGKWYRLYPAIPKTEKQIQTEIIITKKEIKIKRTPVQKLNRKLAKSRNKRRMALALKADKERIRQEKEFGKLYSSTRLVYNPETGKHDKITTGFIRKFT